MWRFAVIASLGLYAAPAMAEGLPDSARVMSDGHRQERRNHGVALALQGDVAHAETAFQALLGHDDACGWTGLGNLHAMRGEFPSALGFYARAQRADSADAGIVLDRAIVLKMMGLEERARAEAAHGVRMAGGEERAASLLALGTESGKAVEFSRVFEIPIPRKRALRFGSWNVRQLIAPADSVATGRRNASAGGPTASVETRSATLAPANAALLFYWKR